MCSQASLNMTKRHLGMEGGKGRAEYGGSVALGNEGGGALFLNDFFKPGQHAGQKLVQALIGLHEVKVVINGHTKAAQHLIEHVAVLGRGNDDAAGPATGLQRPDDGNHFDGLWPSANGAKDGFKLGHG